MTICNCWPTIIYIVKHSVASLVDLWGYFILPVSLPDHYRGKDVQEHFVVALCNLPLTKATWVWKEGLNSDLLLTTVFCYQSHLDTILRFSCRLPVAVAHPPLDSQFSPLTSFVLCERLSPPSLTKVQLSNICFCCFSSVPGWCASWIN